MSDRAKALGALAAFFVASFVGARLLSPWAEVIALWLIIGIGAMSTTFAVYYMLFRPWWTTRIGRAMLASSSGLAMLTDISLVYRWLGDDYPWRDAVLLTVLWVIFVGACYKNGALFLPDRWRSSPSTDHSL